MAILPEKAREWAEQQGAGENLRLAVKDRLLAPRPQPVGSGKLEEYPEDVVIALLQEENARDDVRKAVVSGWGDAYSEVSRLLIEQLDDEAREELRRPFTRVYRVAAVTGHSDLRRLVRQALPNALSSDSLITERQVQEVVAAAMAYPDEVDRAEWQIALKNKDELAAFAFRALLNIDSSSITAIASYFNVLLRKQFVENVTLNCGFLAAFVPDKMGNDRALRLAIKRFRDEHATSFSLLLQDLHDNACWPNTVVKFGDSLGSNIDPSPQYIEFCPTPTDQILTKKELAIPQNVPGIVRETMEEFRQFSDLVYPSRSSYFLGSIYQREAASNAIPPLYGDEKKIPNTERYIDLGVIGKMTCEAR